MSRENPQTTDNGTEHGTQKYGRSKHARGDTAIHGIPYVRDDASAVGERCDGEEPAKKPCDEQSGHVIRARLAYVKQGVDGESAKEDGTPADELRARTPEGRTEHEANEEDGKYEVAYLHPDMKFVRNNAHGRGWRRRSKCTANKVSR